MARGYNEYKLNPNISKEQYNDLIAGLDQDLKAQKEWLEKQELELQKLLTSPNRLHSAVKYSIERQKTDIARYKKNVQDLERQKKAAENQFSKLK